MEVTLFSADAVVLEVNALAHFVPVTWAWVETFHPA
jgi:hypothetical protein